MVTRAYSYKKRTLLLALFLDLGIMYKSNNSDYFWGFLTTDQSNINA